MDPFNTQPDPNLVPIEAPMDTSEEEQSSAAVVTIGDGSSSVPVPAFTLRIGDIVATAPIINFPPPSSISQPQEDYGHGRYTTASEMLKNFKHESLNQSEYVIPAAPPRGAFDFLTTLGLNLPKSSAASKRGSFSASSGAQAFSTINTSFVESSGRINVQPPEFALSNLLEQLEEYTFSTPPVPDTVFNQILNAGGFDSSDPRITKLLALVAQKFVYDVMKDSFVISKAKAAAAAAVSGKAKPKDAKQVLRYEDLSEAAKEYNIKIRKPFEFK